MFDSVLNQRKVAQQRAIGSTISVLVHGAIIGAIIWYSTHKPKADADVGVKVAFLAAAKPAANTPAPPPPPPPKKKKTPKTPVIKKDLVIPKDVPKEKPPEKPPDPTPPDDSDDDSSDDDDGVEGGVEGGVKGGVVGGVVGGQLGSTAPVEDAPVFFGDGMTKPTMNSEESESWHWTTSQRDAKIEGLCLVNCTITKDGRLKDCKILKRIPQVEDAQVMAYLAQMKFHPAMQGNKPISIKSFTIPLRLTQP